jgi:hypothetical protein
MNIFYLDKDPRLAAEYHCDKHVVKMILESAQVLSSAHRFLDGQQVEGLSKSGRKAKRWILNDSRENVLYSVSHLNHPSVVWTRSNIDHYRYLFELFQYLLDEYTYRYKKDHKCGMLLQPLFESPFNIDVEAPWSEPPQAMPEDSKVPGDSVSAYRNYYINHKHHFAKWTRREVPFWYSIVLEK